jgi:hypothetical protein
MNPDHARFAEWDAAYAVGALSSTERREFEEHLSECELCRRAVGELQPTVSLLSRISPERARSIDAELADGAVGMGEPAPAVRDGVVSIARARAVRRRRVWWASAAAAAVLVIAAVALPFALTRSAPTESFALEAVADVPLQATVQLTSVGWGTRIDLECRYTARSDDAVAWPYALAVIGTDGEATAVSTWKALPDSVARLSAATALDVGEITAVEIRSVESGRVLMRYDRGD